MSATPSRSHSPPAQALLKNATARVGALKECRGAGGVLRDPGAGPIRLAQVAKGVARVAVGRGAAGPFDERAGAREILGHTYAGPVHEAEEIATDLVAGRTGLLEERCRALLVLAHAEAVLVQPSKEGAAGNIAVASGHGPPGVARLASEGGRARHHGAGAGLLAPSGEAHRVPHAAEGVTSVASAFVERGRGGHIAADSAAVRVHVPEMRTPGAAAPVARLLQQGHAVGRALRNAVAVQEGEAQPDAVRRAARITGLPGGGQILSAGRGEPYRQPSDTCDSHDTPPQKPRRVRIAAARPRPSVQDLGERHARPILRCERASRPGPRECGCRSSSQPERAFEVDAPLSRSHQLTARPATKSTKPAASRAMPAAAR